MNGQEIAVVAAADAAIPPAVSIDGTQGVDPLESGLQHGRVVGEVVTDPTPLIARPVFTSAEPAAEPFHDASEFRPVPPLSEAPFMHPS
jgi:hypothetical protein